ncbi:predicted protein [Uncinocarpus reesii 1704]|uniref:Uncharacterized protein n=1 Tax=Uncinocarpus reesii (strain UAMH 1704) TaxID=336963 RepID=C4K015_UNCRE|nr:uncharacterized protein UREG_07766 [Uncinocarpus reesii 1704]EEP82901.1 predicted protein [Uncinocarpus reesii 1704]
MAKRAQKRRSTPETTTQQPARADTADCNTEMMAHRRRLQFQRLDNNVPFSTISRARLEPPSLASGATGPRRNRVRNTMREGFEMAWETWVTFELEIACRVEELVGRESDRKRERHMQY